MDLTPEQQLQQVFTRMAEVLAVNMHNELTTFGAECVNRVRDRGELESWKDRTGNLRSSVGFAFYREGEKIVESAFEQVKEDPKGSQTGRRFVEELAKELTSTYALAVVAGMEYAGYVAEKRDVLQSAELYARARIRDVVQSAVNNTIAKINREFK